MVAPTSEGHVLIYTPAKGKRSTTLIREGSDFAYCVADVFNDVFNVDVACAHLERARQIHYLLMNNTFTAPVWCPGCNRTVSRRGKK